MQIQKLQINQPNFRTKVKIDPYAARIMAISDARYKIIHEIKRLEKNGNKDLLSLSLSSKGEDHFYVDATLYEKVKGKQFVSNLQSERIITILESGSPKYVSVWDLYKAAKKSLNEVIVDRKTFNDFAKYI